MALKISCDCCSKDITNDEQYEIKVSLPTDSYVHRRKRWQLCQDCFVNEGLSLIGTFKKLKLSD